MPWLWRRVFDPSSVHIRFVVDRVALEQGFLPILRFHPDSTITPMLHTHVHLHATHTRTNGRNPGTSQTAFGNRGALERKTVLFSSERLRQLVAGLLPRRPVFHPRPVHVRFVMEKLALGQVFLQLLTFYHISIIQPALRTNRLPIILKRANG